MRLLTLAPLAPLVLLAACCPSLTDTRPLLAPKPAPLVLSELNQRAALVSSARIKGKVTITWRDKSGKEDTKSGDGVLLFRQRKTDPVTYEAILVGQVLNNDLFEVGENDSHLWMAQRAQDPKTARVLPKPPNSANDQNPTLGEGIIPLRAATVPFLLGIAPMSNNARRTIVMTNPETVELVSLSPEGLAAGALILERRAPGLPVASRIYRKDGILLGEAQLLDYVKVPVPGPIGDDDIAGPSTQDVLLPAKIVVSYPGSKTTVIFEVNKLGSTGYELNVPFKDSAFKLPDFKKQGLQIETP